MYFINKYSENFTLNKDIYSNIQLIKIKNKIKY